MTHRAPGVTWHWPAGPRRLLPNCPSSHDAAGGGLSGGGRAKAGTGGSLAALLKWGSMGLLFSLWDEVSEDFPASLLPSRACSGDTPQFPPPTRGASHPAVGTRTPHSRPPTPPPEKVAPRPPCVSQPPPSTDVSTAAPRPLPGAPRPGQPLQRTDSQHWPERLTQQARFSGPSPFHSVLKNPDLAVGGSVLTPSWRTTQMAGAWGAGAPDSRRRWNPTRHVARGPCITLPAPQVPPSPGNSDHRASGSDTRTSEASPELHLVPRSARTALMGSTPPLPPETWAGSGLAELLLPHP